MAADDRVEVFLIDEPEPDKNPNLDFVLSDAVAAVAALRARGKTVLLRCAASRRSPGPPPSRRSKARAPVYSESLYNANTGSDRDKDHIACEA